MPTFRAVAIVGALATAFLFLSALGAPKLQQAEAGRKTAVAAPANAAQPMHCRMYFGCAPVATGARTN